MHSDHAPLTNTDGSFTNEQKAAFSWAFSLHSDLCGFVPFWSVYQPGNHLVPSVKGKVHPSFLSVKRQCPAFAMPQSLPLHLSSRHDQTNWEALRGEHTWVVVRRAGRENHNLAAFIPGDISNKKK